MNNESRLHKLSRRQLCLLGYGSAKMFADEMTEDTYEPIEVVEMILEKAFERLETLDQTRMQYLLAFDEIRKMILACGLNTSQLDLNRVYEIVSKQWHYKGGDGE